MRRLNKKMQNDTTIEKHKWNLTEKDVDNWERFNKLNYPMMFGVPKLKGACKVRTQ